MVYKVNGFFIGLLNCYEVEFVELICILVLWGVKLVVIFMVVDIWILLFIGERIKIFYFDVFYNVIFVWVLENYIFVVYCNWVGVEIRFNV